METTTENKMGTKPVWSLLLTMALPVILSTAAQSLYNIVDGIFVSMLGEDAMAAITFAGPCTKVLIALGTGIAVGMNTMSTPCAVLRRRSSLTITAQKTPGASTRLSGSAISMPWA